MSTYTQNYSLHQWEDTDDFLRSDFNEDFQKIDTGLGSLKTNIATNAYNIYNLILQNYYENKYTGYKQALLFDGFMDSELEGRTLSDSMACWGDMLLLYETGQASITTTGTGTYSSTSATLYTPYYPITAPGIVTGFTFKIYSGVSGATQRAACMLNGVVVETPYYYYSSGGEATCTLESPITVGPGDTVRFYTYSNQDTVIYYAASVNSLAGTLNVTPVEGTSGTMTQTLSMGSDWSQCHLYVRYSGGAVTATVNGTALALQESQSAYTLDGADCTEVYLLGNGGSDTLALVLQATLGDDASMKIYDYGLIFQ